ncbi:MAG: hypothetical protein NTY71_04725 [Methanoregula sp.]|jgi:hypothetical protein|nr:hypothetical protein [Methanoregula sp.]
MIPARSAAITILCIVCFSILVLPVCAADATSSQSGTDVVTRGQRFTVTVTGRPNTPYYVWVARTFSMTGEYGDRPPVIVGSTENVAQDSPGGPYPIGSYAYRGGNGRTIIEDVAPSTADISNTRYYALVTTDAAGRAIVAFQTLPGTAEKTFSIRQDNPQYSDSGTVMLELGGTTKKPVITTAPPTTIPATPPPAPGPTPEPTHLTPLSQTPTPTHATPWDTMIVILAVGLGLLGRGKR